MHTFSDNIDKNVKPRNLRIDAQTKSLHYIQMFSVKDKIDLGKLSDVRPTGEKSLYNLLPSTEDFEKLNESFAVHVARVMVEYIPLKISAVLYSDTYPTNQSDTYLTNVLMKCH